MSDQKIFLLFGLTRSEKIEREKGAIIRKKLFCEENSKMMKKMREEIFLLGISPKKKIIFIFSLFLRKVPCSAQS